MPNGTDQTVYLVLNDFGSHGRAYCETSAERADLVISDLMSGQYSAPVLVVAFNTAEQTAKDVSEDIALEIMRRVGISGGKCLRCLKALSIAISVPKVNFRCGWREYPMTTLTNLLARKQKLLERLQDNPGPHERAEIEGLLARINAALDLLEEAGESSDDQ